MSASCYEDLIEHVGHNIECVVYGPDAVNVTVECVTCHTILMDFDKPIEDVWGEDNTYSREDWQDDVSGGNTNLGYWEWAQHRREAE